MDQIFDLNAILPPLESEEEKTMVQNLDQVSQKIVQIYAAGHELPEEYAHHVLQLTDQVVESLRAGMVLGHIFLMIHEFSAMNDLYTKLIKEHGETEYLLFYHAIALEQLNELDKASQLYKKVLASGVKNFFVYMQCAKCYRKIGLYTESTATANLAVYENEENSIEPFVLMAQNFYDQSEHNRMYECFSRIEKIAGREALAELGQLYEEHADLYKNLKKMMKI